ncbi:PREDICTED: salutaridinol 7-O-acetyltransferase-like [Ipomoea nil]|uniref:salutaridinol 7-O-acetyltransferase-like n=1 Tax=Ipomoea nil TaxID=35883 RepID=UPI000901AA4C|nr:PREDICTED: salutaridinol 7-O-acetyltransferase-like [Ipomoea nil]
MALKVEIHQKENVRPFSPTPHSLRNYKLSQIDQIEGTHYTSMLFFYNSGGAHHHDYDELKQSLSKTLSVFYPVAGRVKDGMTIECTDEGVDFVRVNVTNYDLSDLLQICTVDHLRQLLPFDPYPMDFDPSQPMLGVQVNKFRCGGTAVAICLWHGVADAAAIGGFVQTWSAINRGEGGGGGNLVVDATAIFPPALNFDFSAPTFAAAKLIKTSGGKYSKKRFVFRKEEIERMRDEYILPDRRRPSSVEALSAFLWAAVIRANQNAKMHILIQVTDLRKRLNPSFQSMCLGNFVYVTAARWMSDGAGGVTAQSLVGKIRESIKKVTGEHVSKIEVQGGLTTEVEKIAAFGVDAIKFFGISSLCGFPFHEFDFGWSKPIWFLAAPFNLTDGANLYKTGDGGIEAIIGLIPQVMSSLDKDKEFLDRVSSIQTMSSELPTLPSNY